MTKLATRDVCPRGGTARGEEMCDSRRHAVRRPEVAPGIGPAGLGVTQAEGPEHCAAIGNRHDQDRAWRKPMLQLREAAFANLSTRFRGHVGAEQRSSGTNDVRDGADEIVAADAAAAHQRTDVHLAGP
jgi:hypothetical protein